MNRIIGLLFTLISISVFAQDKPAYLLYSKEGNQVTYEYMIEDLSKSDMVFFGELHNNPISHWLELEVTKSLHSKAGEKLVLGAEMYEADNQIILDEYLSGLISGKKYEAEMRLWANDKTDYRPLVDFAKDNKLPFMATNIPRRYASLVFMQGFEGLNQVSDEGKKFFAPLPMLYDSTVACYKNMMTMEGMGDHAMPTMPMSQCSKDATMAHFTYKNYEKGKLFIHYNGAYHSDNYEGIVWHLKQADKKLTIKTITTVSKEDITSLTEEEKAKADYIIIVPENMTSTH